MTSLNSWLSTLGELSSKCVVLRLGGNFCKLIVSDLDYNRKFSMKNQHALNLVEVNEQSIILKILILNKPPVPQHS